MTREDEHVRDEHVKDAAQDVAEEVTQDVAEGVLVVRRHLPAAEPTQRLPLGHVRDGHVRDGHVRTWRRT